MAHLSLCLWEEMAFAARLGTDHPEFIGSKGKVYDSSKCLWECCSISFILKPDGFQPGRAQAIAEGCGHFSLRSASQSHALLSATATHKSIQSLLLPCGNMQAGTGSITESNKSFLVLEKDLSKSELGQRSELLTLPLKRGFTWLQGRSGAAHPKDPTRVFRYMPDT